MLPPLGGRNEQLTSPCSRTGDTNDGQYVAMMPLAFALVVAAAISAAGVRIFDSRAQTHRLAKPKGIASRLIPIRLFQPQDYDERGREYLRAAIICWILTAVLFAAGAIVFAIAS